MKQLLLVLMFGLVFMAKAQQKTGLIYDDNVQKRNLPSFNAIKISSAIDLYLSQSNSNEVAVSASTLDVRNHIVTEVEGGTLIIRMDNNNNWWDWKKWGNTKLKAYVSVKELNALTGSGATNIHIMGALESDKLIIKLSGASDLRGELNVGNLNITVSGASNIKSQVKAIMIGIDGSGASVVELTGTVNDLSVEVSGASEAKLYNLNAKGAIVKASGASSANVNVSTILKAHASGASNINYKGSALREGSASGASDIKHRN
jgi:hypothetical protein